MPKSDAVSGFWSYSNYMWFEFSEAAPAPVQSLKFENGRFVGVYTETNFK